MLSRLSLSLIVLLSTMIGAPAIAEEAAAPAAPALPPWMSAEVIKAAVAINLTDAQAPEFNKAVGDYVTDHFAMIQKVMKVGAPNIDMTIRSKDNSLVKKMDEKVHKILTEPQWPAYEDYKKVLRAGLKP